MTRESITPLARLARWSLAWVAALAATIAGCGGGVGVGGTGSFASGPITGFGSVIVNGVRYDDRSAAVESEDDDSFGRDRLGLGMYAEVDGGPIGGTSAEPTATATRIRIASALVGPVSAIDAAQGTLTVLDQLVKLTPTTVYAPLTLPNGLASIQAGAVLAVHGTYDAAAGAFVATRLERRLLPPQVYKLRGVVHGFDPAARTFMIGAATFSAATLPAGFTDGRYVLVVVETTQANGLWVVRRIDAGRPDLPDLDRAEIRGTVTAFTSSRSFSVNGQPVDASAASFPDGEAFGLGAQVKVRGASSAGTLRAVLVNIESAGGTGGDGEFELIGSVASLQTASQTFVVQGEALAFTVDYSAAQFDHGSAADLRDGAQVEVHADPVDGSTQLVARLIRFR